MQPPAATNGKQKLIDFINFRHLSPLKYNMHNHKQNAIERPALQINNALSRVLSSFYSVYLSSKFQSVAISSFALSLSSHGASCHVSFSFDAPPMSRLSRLTSPKKSRWSWNQTWIWRLVAVAEEVAHSCTKGRIGHAG